MKKLLLLLIVVLSLTACNKTGNDIENDYYIITHDAVPVQNKFIEKSAVPVSVLRNNIESGSPFNIDNVISEVEKIGNDAKAEINNIAKDIKSELGREYINNRLTYIDSVVSATVNVLVEFKKQDDKNIQSFISVIKDAVISTTDDIESLIDKEEDILRKMEDILNQNK